MARKQVNPVEMYLTSAESAQSARTRAHPGDALVDRAKYVDLKQIAQILDRSALRVRKIVNSGGIASIRREGKIFCLKADVTRYKREKLTRSAGNKQARLERSKKRVVRATTTISELVRFDSSLSEEERAKFLRSLANYREAARNALKAS